MANIKITDFLGDLGSLRWDYTPDEIATDMDESGNRKASVVAAPSARRF